MNRRHPLPAEVYALVEHSPATVLLEGGKPDGCDFGEKPWTQLFTAPLRVCTAYTAEEILDLFAAIEHGVAEGRCAAGFFTYECGNCFEPKAGMRPPPAGTPLAWFGIYERSYVFNHEAGEFEGAIPPGLERMRTDKRSVTGHEFTRAEQPQKNAGALVPEETLDASFTLTEAEYAQRIAAIHEWIRAGDVYQLNFTAPFRVNAPGSVASHYARLRARQPVNYGAFLHWQPGHYVLSFSPELFFRVDRAGDARRIVTRPMKGTAPRGRTTREDRQVSEWLRTDAKNRSENLMIVDLLRNDLGRLARFGTVRVEDLFNVERYPTLWQMTSTISAELRPGIGFHDIFRALFPCGSITGAPKVRAMQLIAELEKEPRGIYSGAIGFFSPQQTVFNVAIRTLALSGGQGTFGAGSGVVIDSDPAEEFRECLLKAKFLTDPAHRTSDRLIVSQPDEFFLIETMLWNGAYTLLNLHLDRLADSADYFGFACDRAAIRSALEQHARQFVDASPRKVRLLLIDADGNFSINSEPLASSADPARVRISSHRTDPADPTLYHKTTQRPLYALEYQKATRNGYDDVLFLNLRGEVTEGAISNVFIEKEGRWFTPPIECGLLAGVYRRHLLETRPDIEERVLTLDDLHSADVVYLTNAVRGLRRVTIDW
ncbi:Para-aminobenzoate synthase, subunit I [Candidatus Sulfotelmatomonas gaucii]|uniref:Para-aminobenzoate synthase, subunit I n=1 Tax=Candidatus Sulfuritelmatomonas gaucii TaxID=2043161 RepID=A0A2N9M0K0_9BACT|nr:Para-aminobenzoate synthase, subunit I [Candidatus Sulfotelmatomonas gaucii]